MTNSFTSHIARQKRIAKRTARKRQRNDTRAFARIRTINIGDDSSSPPSALHPQIVDKSLCFLAKEQRSRQKRSQRFDRRLDTLIELNGD